MCLTSCDTMRSYIIQKKLIILTINEMNCVKQKDKIQIECILLIFLILEIFGRQQFQ